MTEYTPTTDEVDTGFTTFAWDLEREQPGTYEAGSGFEDYHEVCAAFRRWHAEERRKAAEKAFDEGWESAIHGFDLPDWGGPGFEADSNPYRKEQNED